MKRNKFYIGVDCEGVACCVGTPGKGLAESSNYPFAARQAALEANAAATALFDMGAKEVLVWDNHHTGVNMDYNLLDSRCKIVLGSGHKGRFPAIDESFGGVLFIGYHSRENTRNATLAHTYCSTAFQYYKINGIEAGELEIDAAFAGLKQVPVLFVSSDDITVKQAKTAFPWIESVETKQSLSWNSAISLHPKAACEQIYAGVIRSCERLEEMRCYQFAVPLQVEIRYKRMDDASSAMLYDKDGNKFAFVDAFTRKGTVSSITSLF